MFIISQTLLKVWLDDVRPMPEAFNIHCKTADEAIQLLSGRNVAHISFDHDLGEGKSGYDVANWIEKEVFQNDYPRLGWDVHSANPIGAARIKIVMQRCDQKWSEKDNL